MSRLTASRPRRMARAELPARPQVAMARFCSILDLDAAGFARCLSLAARLKRDRPLLDAAPTSHALGGRHVALLFDKPSLRTRTTFEIAIRELGGHAIVIPPEVALGGREPVADVARNLERWVAAAVIRTFAQARVEALAAAAPRLKVVNALTDEEHPCQALADCLALQERLGALAGRTIAFVGDGNNVATSLAHAAVLSGMTLHVATPDGYALPGHVVEACARVARHGAEVRQFRDPFEAVRGADAVYTDVWTSMGQEAEADERRRRFAPYQVNAALMAAARPGALFMHCLPAHRGEEVTEEVIESPASIVFDQAENRLHTQKAILLMLLGGA